MLTQKLKYGLKALVVLALEKSQSGQSLRIDEIAKRSGAPKRFLEHILLEFRDAGFIESIRGRNGGYVLARQPEDISLPDLIRLVDGPIAPLPCLSRTAYRHCPDCPDEVTCRLRNVFDGVFSPYLQSIERLSLADFLKPLAKR